MDVLVALTAPAGGLPFAQFDLSTFLLALLIGLIAGVVVSLAGIKFTGGRLLKTYQDQADRIVESAREDAGRLRREHELELKEELFAKRENIEKEVEESRRQLQKWEDRLAREQEELQGERKRLDKRSDKLEDQKEKLEEDQREVKETQQRYETLIDQGRRELHRVAEMSRDEARDRLLSELETELEHEQAQLIQRMTDKVQEEAENEARKILTTAIQRVAADHTAEVTTSVVHLPNDEMKGRIIGREGRNIRAFEKATGVDVIIDDTPEVVVISAFDAVRRELARRAMDSLVEDGRIHPTRIEEMVEKTRGELNKHIAELGKQASFDADIAGLHPKILTLLGRMHFRTSYGQNVLAHSIEVAHLCATLAGELGLDVTLARRCGLLHDIGKAVDHEFEGGHPEIGADFARKYGEQAEVVNAIASHHNGVPQEYIYSFVTMAADAISGSRPGARRETLERYIKRMQKLEDVASDFPGVTKAYAIQAGREVRVAVDAKKVNDAKAMKLARDIAKEIESKLTYPGEVKVTVLRETRVIEYAR